MKNTSKNVPTLDGSKLNWRLVGPLLGRGRIADHPAVCTGGRPPAEVGVHNHHTDWTVVFDYVETVFDGETVTLNYQGVMPDGRVCALALASG